MRHIASHKLKVNPIKMTNKISRKTTIFFLVLMLGLGSIPMSSYANSNGNSEEKREDKKEKLERKKIEHREDKEKKVEKKIERKIDRTINKNCRAIFSRLFNAGFFLNQSDINLFIECLRPFGINASFSGVSSSTPDTLAPVISNLSAKPNTVKSTITWNTNEKSDSTVFWSTSAGVNVNSSSTLNLTKSDRVKEHKLVIENLNASTTYYFVVRSKDAYGNTSTSTEGSFTTKQANTDNAPPIISSVTLLVGTSTANIGWHTNENATSRVYYGTSSSLDVNASTTNFVENSTLKQNHSILLSGLSTSTLYYFASESRDANGNRTVTPIFSATTLGL